MRMKRVAKLAFGPKPHNFSKFPEPLGNGPNDASSVGMTHNKATFGIYRSKEEVNAAVSLLSALGFGESRASVFFPDHGGAQDFPQVQKSEIAKFARVGAMIGAVFFMGFMMLALSGVIPFAPTDQIPAEGGRVFLIVGAAMLGAIIGAACGTLVGIGTPDRAGHRYGQYVHAGGILLSVHSDTPEEEKRVHEILEKSGAQDITSVEEELAWKDVMDEKGNLERVSLTRVEDWTGHGAQPTRSLEELVEEKQSHV